jgi:hypothetical protein
MAAALEGASERQHMVVAENLSGHITPLRRSAIARRQLARCSDSESATLRLSCAPPPGRAGPPGGHHAPSGAHTGPGTSARVGPGRVPLGTLPVLCKPPAEFYRSPALLVVATARPGHDSET